MDINFLKTLISELNQCAEYLYQEKKQEGYGKLVTLLPQLESVLVTLEGDDQLLFMKKLQRALEVMENGDNTLLADMIEYEMIEQLQTYVK